MKKEGKSASDTNSSSLLKKRDIPDDSSLSSMSEKL
jgi:hypothetical protein